jgi:transcriptional regulator with XRE-family HTH domain
METGKLIKELRIQKGMTQEELADKTEVSTRTIQRIEHGEVDPRSYTLQMIAKALEVDYSIFVEEGSEERREIRKIDTNNWLGLMHLSGVIPIVLPSMLIWHLKKDKIEGIAEHYRAVIIYQLMIFGILLGCLWTYWKVNILTPFIGVLVMNALLSIANTILVMSGDPYIKMPFIRYAGKKSKS